MMAFAQSGQQDSTADQVQQKQANQSAENDVNGMNTAPHASMTGMVSNGGKTFTSDNVAYQVANPDKLKNYDGQTVSVKTQYNSGKNTIKINKVMPASGQ
jgi:hypothetical protein